MAFDTGNFPVLPVQRKCSESMVEQPCLPVKVIMAFQARSALCPELLVVYLSVTFQAVGGELGELLNRRTRITCFNVAGPAGLFPVCPFQRVTRKGMVEGDVTPTGIFMARCALFVRIVLRIQNCCMNILMTVITLDAYLPEFPAIVFPVTVEAGNGPVGPAKYKWGAVVSFDGEQGGGESLFSMALRAVGCRGSGGELFPVIICMAVGAAGVFQSSRIPVLVAGGAGDRYMFSFQRESGSGVVKVTCILDLLEGDFGMAFRAVLPEPVLVHIPVAFHTAFVGNSPEDLGLRSIPDYSPVAFGAFHLLMFSQQFEVGPVVVESGCRAEFIETMTGGTICTQRPLVVVVVAVRTLLPESQVGIGPIPELPVTDEFFFMTLAAIDPAMRSLKCIPRQ